MAHVTIPAVDPRVSYTAAGGQTVFPIPFPFLTLADIRVSVSGTPVTSGFSITGAAADGGYTSGTLTFTSGRTAGAAVTIYRETANARTTDFPYPSVTLNVQSLNTELDRLTAVDGDLARMVRTAVRTRDGEAPLGTLPTAAARAGKVLGFDSAGQVTVFSSLDQSAQTVTPTGAVVAQPLAQILSREDWIDNWTLPGDGDNTSLAIQRAHDAAFVSGYGITLKFRAKQYWLRSACVFKIPVGMIGTGGGAEHYQEAVSAPPTAAGTWFLLESSAFTPFTYRGDLSADYQHTPRGSVARNISIWQKHPTPGVGWTPTDYPPVFDFKATGGQLFLDDIFCLAVNKLVKTDNGGRHHFGRINGQFFNYVARIEEVYDEMRIGKWHCWNFWTANANVLAFQQANLNVMDVYRCDGFHADSLFSIYSNSVIKFSDGTNGVTNTGSAIEFSVGHLYADSTRYGLLCTGSGIGVNKTSGYVGHMYHLGELVGGSPMTDSAVIKVTGSNASLTIGRFSTLGCQNAVWLGGQGGNRVTLLDPAQVQYNWGTTGGFAFRLDAAGTQGGNTLFLNAVPVPTTDRGTAGVFSSVGAGSVVSSGLWDNDTTGNVANFLRGSRVAAGQIPYISAAGTDANITLGLAAKGTGGIAFLASTSNAAGAASGLYLNIFVNGTPYRLNLLNP